MLLLVFEISGIGSVSGIAVEISSSSVVELTVLSGLSSVNDGF